MSEWRVEGFFSFGESYEKKTGELYSVGENKKSSAYCCCCALFRFAQVLLGEFQNHCRCCRSILSSLFPSISFRSRTVCRDLSSSQHRCAKSREKREIVGKRTKKKTYAQEKRCCKVAEFRFFRGDVTTFDNTLFAVQSFENGEGESSTSMSHR